MPGGRRILPAGSLLRMVVQTFLLPTWHSNGELLHYTRGDGDQTAYLEEIHPGHIICADVCPNVEEAPSPDPPRTASRKVLWTALLGQTRHETEMRCLSQKQDTLLLHDLQYHYSNSSVPCSLFRVVSHEKLDSSQEIRTGCVCDSHFYFHKLFVICSYTCIRLRFNSSCTCFIICSYNMVSVQNLLRQLLTFITT